MFKLKQTLMILWLMGIRFITFVGCSEKDITFGVGAGRIECFYETVKKGQVLDIEYQVIDGGHGDLDISFQLYEPNGKLIATDYKKSDNYHRNHLLYDGDYRFCFDNTISSMNTKIVFFELIIEEENNNNNGESGGDENLNPDIFEGLTPDELYESMVENLRDVIMTVHTRLSKIRQTQELLRTFEARDRNIAEENYFRVNTWSMVQIVLMICVGCIQVFMVKSLFETNQNAANIWKKLAIK